MRYVMVELDIAGPRYHCRDKQDSMQVWLQINQQSLLHIEGSAAFLSCMQLSLSILPARSALHSEHLQLLAFFSSLGRVSWNRATYSWMYFSGAVLVALNLHVVACIR
jgi:hypothetical protein